MYIYKLKNLKMTVIVLPKGKEKNSNVTIKKRQGPAGGGGGAGRLRRTAGEAELMAAAKFEGAGRRGRVYGGRSRW